jgi:hypothetical protein
MSKKGQGWFGESKRHSLASRGIKTGQKNYSSNTQKVPWKDAKKIQSIELGEDNTVVEKTISDEINEEKIPEEEKPENEELSNVENPDTITEIPEDKPKKKGLLIDVDPDDSIVSGDD